MEREQTSKGRLVLRNRERDSIYETCPRFASARTEQELAILDLVEKHLANLDSRRIIDTSDPLRLRGLLRSVSAQGGSTTPRQREYAQAILDQTRDVEKYLEGWVQAVKTLETISTVVAASRLIAIAQDLGQVGIEPDTNDDDSKLGVLWSEFQAGLSLSEESLRVPQFLADPSTWPGANCGEAPPADGSAPPGRLQAVGSSFLSVVYRLLVGAELGFGSVEEKRVYSPYVREYWNRLNWYVERRAGETQKEHDLDGLLGNYLVELKAVLDLIGGPEEADPARDFAGAHVSFQRAEVSLIGTMRHRIDYGAVLDLPVYWSPPSPPGGVSEAESLDESAFNWVNNVEHWDGEESDFTNPDQVDGRISPIFRVGNVFESWLELPYDALPAPLAFDFILWRTTRKLSHIDYRFRRAGEEEVIKEFRHEVTPDGQIALGQKVSVYDLRDEEDIYQSYILHAIPVTEANHPNKGICSFVNIKWVSGAELGLLQPGPLILAHGTDIADTRVSGHPPPIPYDAVCWYHRVEPILWEEDIPRRNVYIRPSSSPSRPYRIVPHNLYISTSGESIRITNQDDSSPHRFRTTDNSRFGILGAVGGSGDEREIDTGWLDPGDDVVITLPTGLPSPYWFNLVEVNSLGDPITEHPRIHIVYRNWDCLGER